MPFNSEGDTIHPALSHRIRLIEQYLALAGHAADTSGPRVSSGNE
jgi:hypothetical protein